MRDDKHTSVPMRQVNSTHVHSIGYDPTSNELHVQYQGGGKYVYKDVPPEKARIVMAAGSVGSMLHRHIKGQHDHDQIFN